MAACGKRARTSDDDSKDDQADGLLDLSLDLRETLNDPKSSDVTFVCKGGDKVYGSRWLLSRRCPYFKAMFDSNMLESKMDEISLENFTSTVLLWVFEYLYTGLLPSDPKLKWKLGFEIIPAANFFLVPKLNLAVVHCLLKEAKKFQKDSFSVIIGMLNDALEVEGWWEGRDLVLLELTENLLDEWWFDVEYWCVEDFPIRELSEDTLEFLLSKARRSRWARDRSQSLQEYLIFRQIVEWLVHQNLPALDEEVLQKLQEILPIGGCSDLLWETVAIGKYPMSTGEITLTVFEDSGSHNSTTLLNSRLGLDIPNERFERLLKYIDWCRIPAMLLVKVIHPLGVISSHAFSEVLAFHALHRSVDGFNVEKWWKCSGFVSSVSDGDFYCKSNDGLRSAGGKAVAILPMTRSCGTYEWKLGIREYDADEIWFGIISGLDNAPWEKYDLAVQSLKSCPATKLLVLKWGVGIISAQDTDPRPLMYWEKLSKKSMYHSLLVNFTLNRSSNFCCVRIDGEVLITWWDLPDAVFHPVFETVRAKHVSADIEACRGFHYL